MIATDRAPRLLFVDDDERFAATVCGLLEDDGYDVVGIINRAVDVPAAAGELAPDLVIIDFVLPDGDGLTVADWLRQDGHEGPILVFSSLFDRKLEATSIEEGYGYVVKADGLDALEAAIDESLGTKGA